jgi:hypothetical protein
MYLRWAPAALLSGRCYFGRPIVHLNGPDPSAVSEDRHNSGGAVEGSPSPPSVALEVHEWTARMERLEASSVSVEEVGEAEKGRARAGFRRQTSASSLLCSC